MFSIGITGHQALSPEASWAWVSDAVRDFLKPIKQPWQAISSLAIGSDQLFAEIALEMEAELIAVLPFEDYERTFQTNADIEKYRALLRRSESVIYAKSADVDEVSFLNAGLEVVRRSNALLAIWNGDEAQGLGGTADIVAVARTRDVAVTWIDPYKKDVITL